jgi:hypothetical protein
VEVIVVRFVVERERARIIEEYVKLQWKPIAQVMSRGLLFTLGDEITTFEV